MNTTRITVSAFAILLAVPAFSENYVWDDVYRPQDHRTTAPATAEGTMKGLDAKARGFDVTSVGTSVDKWFLSWCCSNMCRVNFSGPGQMIIIR